MHCSQLKNRYLPLCSYYRWVGTFLFDKEGTLLFLNLDKDMAQYQ